MPDHGVELVDQFICPVCIERKSTKLFGLHADLAYSDEDSQETPNTSSVLPISNAALQV